MSAGSAPPSWGFDLKRLLRAIRARWRWLAKLNLAVAALATRVVLLLPRWYESSVTLVPATNEGATHPLRRSFLASFFSFPG